MNFILSVDEETQERYELERSEDWDLAKQQIEQIIGEFGWTEVEWFVRSVKPKGFTGTLPDGRETVNGLSIN